MGYTEPADGMTETIVGTWRLLSFELRYGRGAVVQPWGSGISGFLAYTADGYMFTLGQRQDRPAFVSGDAMRPTPEEALRAVEGFLAYGGTYAQPEPGTIVHTVECSLSPNWVGTSQVRFFERTGDRLAIRTAPFPTADGDTVIAVLNWERAAP